MSRLYSTKILSLAALSAVLLSTSAHSADVFGRESTKDTTYAPESGIIANFSGFYVGGRIGYGNANHNLTVEQYENGVTEVVCAPEDTDCTDVEGKEGRSEELFGLDGINSAGIVGGGQIGFDIQRGRFVVGVFGSYDFSGMETTVSMLDTNIVAIEKGDEWSVGARAGLIVAPRTMLYALAAYTETDYTFAGLADDGVGSKDITFSGITAGAGVEYALTNNIFMGIEGTHTFYGKEKLADSCTGDETCGEEGTGGMRLIDDLGETKVMGTLKIKLNSTLPSLLGN